ncbi:hypothetical protein Ddc_23143 [Ditylenchus destructor]|nr:hypothetical protein Ddc_23143 [Ditylenchus destructor]
MHRSDQLSDKQDAKPENKARKKTKKSLSDNRISKIATLDNGTMVETFKYLNYCQLATNSLVSKRYCDLIQTHRHMLALLNVDCIRMSDVFNLLAATIDRSNRGRLQCEELEFNYEGNAQKFFNWIKDHVRCVKFRIAVSNSSAYRDKQLLDFFATGSHCTSEIVVIGSHISKAVIIDFVQIFMDLKNSDESRMVELIRGNVSKPTAEALKTIYNQFIVRKETNRHGCVTEHVYEFVNADIGKKLKLTITTCRPVHQVKVEIINL